MNKDHLHRLIERYLAGTASETERQELLQWYYQMNERDVEWETEYVGEKEDVKMRILRHIGERSFLAKPKGYGQYIKYAAAMLLFISISFGTFFLIKENVDSGMSEIIVSVEQVENRYLLLPDSSIVILRPGSTLTYVSDFRGDTREVRLEGEAYFDVRSKPEQPFVIHTGDVKTTVLGTKFTIRTEHDKGGVEVTVKEGKVRVEREKHVIAELIANQQVQYDLRTQESMQEQLKEETVAFAWTSTDMRFDAMAFGELAERLERRYDVQIAFENNTLAGCPVSGKFDGTESLDDVLDILCATRNARYERTESNRIIIKGNGC